MASSAPERTDGWTRWLWVPIVLPGLVLVALAWRAVVGEQRFLERQVQESQVRLAAQMAGLLQGTALEAERVARQDLTRWVLDDLGEPVPPPLLFESAEVFVAGRKVEQGGAFAPDEGAELGMELAQALQDLTDSGGGVGLASAERFLLDVNHASEASLRGALGDQLDRLDSLLERPLSIQPHWRPVFQDLSRGARRRIEVAQANRRDSGVFEQLREGNGSGVVTIAGRPWIVLRPPDLPQGVAVVASFSHAGLRELLLPRLRARPGASDTGLHLGLQDAQGRSLGPLSPPAERHPEVVVPIPGGFPPWSVVVWTSREGTERAARGRVFFLTGLLGLSFLTLSAAAVLGTRSLAAQRQLLSMKTDFVSNITHELKTPLTSIHLYGELIAGGRAGARAPEFGGMVVREARRLETMIEGILAFAREEAGAGTARWVRTELSALVRETCEAARDRARGRGIELTCELAPVHLEGDPALLRSVVGNLLDNAIKYGREQGRIRVSLAREPGVAVLQVQDDGPGIPRADRSRIFERFYRGGGELTRTVPGTGLGLAIVRRAVEIHGGRVEVRSGEGRGSLFEVRLPLGEEADA